jgi:recombination protein RecA
MSTVYERINKLSKSYKMIDEPEFISTGSPVLDALYGGGIPKGTFTLFSSASGIGKSTICLYICKSYCFQGHKVLYLDFEGGVNKNQLDGIGLSQYKYDGKTNPEGNFFIFRVHTFADAEKFLDALLGTGISLVVIDSATAILPKKLLEKSIEDANPGVLSQRMSSLLLKYKALCSKEGISWIMVNQIRTKISFTAGSGDGEAGGHALKFYSDYRIMMKKAYKGGDMVTEEKTPRGIVKVPYGSVNEIWCIKSRFTRPYIPLRVAVVFGKGIWNVNAYMDFLMNKGYIKKNGAWFDVKLDGGKETMQGEKAVLDYLRSKKDEVAQLIKDLGGYRLILDEVSSKEGEVYYMDDDGLGDEEEDTVFEDEEGDNIFGEDEDEEKK